MNQKTIKIIISIIVILAIGAIGFFSFGGKKSTNDEQQKTVILGSSPGPYSDLFINGIKPILEKEGYKVENKSFNNLMNADIAMNQNQVNLNVDQHTAYLNNFNHENKSDLVPITKIPTVPTGIYPAKKTQLKQVTKGDRIAIPNDPSNTARAYSLLVKAGFIKMKTGTDLIKATKKDIAENKYNLKITEMDSATIPRSESDFDYVILPGSIAYSAKISTIKMIMPEDVIEDYKLIAATNKQNKNSAWVKAVKKAYNSKEFKNYLKKVNNKNYWIQP